MTTFWARLRRFYIDHRWFLALLLLFASFRLFAILLLRPGGFIADNSDYEFYYAWGLTIPMGYTTFENLWTAYPPLFAALITGTFVTERVFGIPGLGAYFVSSITNRAYSVIMRTTLLFAFFVVNANFLVDLTYAWLDPRIRYD